MIIALGTQSTYRGVNACLASCLNSVLNVGAFSVIVKTDGALHSSSLDTTATGDWSPWRCWWCSWRGRAACWGRSGCCGGCRGCWSGTCANPELCPASWRLAWPVEEVGDQVAAQEAATHQHQGRGLGGGHPPSVWPRPRQRVEAESSTISPALSSRYFNIKLWNYVQFKHLEDKY